MFELIAFICGIAMYFVPAIIAHYRQHVSSGAIFLTNLLLGWSIIGWIVCFAWACSGNTRQQVVILPPAYRR
jgi:Superinfection immunity protein